MRGLKIFLVFVAVVGMLSFGQSPRELKVPQDYKTIQTAITAALPGDTVLVAAGIYSESLLIDKPLTLRGEDRDQVILDGSVICQESRSAIRAAARGVRLEALTITKCVIGVEVQGSAELVNVALRANALGVQVQDLAQVSLEDSILTDNAVGVEAWVGARLSITSTSISGSNVAVKTLRNVWATLARSQVLSNAIGVEVWDSRQVTIDTVRIADNSGDGLWVRGPTGVQITVLRSVIAANGENGIRLGASPNQPDVITADIRENVIQNNRGCGVWADAEKEIRVTGGGNQISGNGAGNLCPPTFPWPQGF